MKKSFLAFVVLTVVLSMGLPVFAQPRTIIRPGDKITDLGTPEMQELEVSLQKFPTHLEYTMYQMLKHKYSKDFSKNTRYSYVSRPTGPSPLSYEYRGSLGLSPQGFAYFDNSLYEGVDVITGMEAIKEGYQIDSIGAERATSRDNPSTVPTYQLSDIETLTIKTHPWQSMMADKKPVVPDIFRIAPDDYFAVYFKNLKNLRELEGAIKDLGEPMQLATMATDSIALKNRILDGVGYIGPDTNFLPDAEMLFVSYDLDIYPATDYAIIFGGDSIPALRLLFRNDESKAMIGDYFVAASNKMTLERIREAEGGQNSLAQSLDLKYMTTVLGSDYEGLIFISDAFISKLTGPEYRIVARRRNTVLGALETLQYTSFAYKALTGKWANDLDEIIRAGYIDPKSVEDTKDYNFDTNGIVHHKTWGSIYDVTPIDRVRITTVTELEKRRYEDFVEDYQMVWREFIDPVGISIDMDKLIHVRTVILPLLDEGAYEWLSDVAIDASLGLDMVRKPDRAGSTEGIISFDPDAIINKLYREVSYSKRNLSDKEIREEAIKEISKEIGWKDKRDPLAWIGNEIVLGVGGDFAFNGGLGFSRLDVYLGIELKDKKLASDFLDQVFKSLFADMGGGANFGFFSINKPIRNEYNGHEYFMIPTGYINLFYTFIDDRLYLTLSQLAINSLVDGGGKAKRADIVDEAINKVSVKQNVMLLIDGEKTINSLRGMINESWGSYAAQSSLRKITAYHKEMLALSKAMANYNGTSDGARSYYHNIPTRWIQADIYTKDGNPRINIGGVDENLYSIDLNSYSYYYESENEGVEEDKIELDLITDNFNLDLIIDKWKPFKALVVGLAFTEDGLDINLAVNNPNFSGKSGDDSGINIDSDYVFIIYVVIGAIILAGIIIIVAKKRKMIPPTTTL